MGFALAVGMIMVLITAVSRVRFLQWVVPFLAGGGCLLVMGVGVTMGASIPVLLLASLQTLLIPITWTSPHLPVHRRTDVLALQLAVTAGAIGMVTAHDWVSFFISLELVSIISVVLVWFGRRPEVCIEAAVKYFVMSAMVTGVLVLGMACVLVDTGQMGFPLVMGGTWLSSVGFVLVAVSLLTKVGVMPFHWWVVDVYSVPSPYIVAHLSTIPKLAAVVVLMMLMGAAHPLMMPLPGAWVLIGLVSALGGALAAVVYTKPSYVLAASSMSQMGLLFLLPATHSPYMVEVTLWGMAVYGVTSVVLWFVLDRVDVPKGLARSAPALMVLSGLALLSMMGIPPFPGFLSKALLIKELLWSGWWVMLGVVVSVLVGAMAYIRLFRTMITGHEPPVQLSLPTQWVAGILLVVMGCGTVYPDCLMWPVHWVSEHCLL